MEAKQRKELKQPALYILLSETSDKVYIGETEDFLARLSQHDAKKSFWEDALIFISKDNDLTKSDIKYLEYLAIDQVKNTARFNIEENKTTPKETNLPEHQKATMQEFFDDICFLTSFIGNPMFEKNTRHQQEVLFHHKVKRVAAKGFYNENGFTVLKGAKLPLKSNSSYYNKVERTKKLENYTRNIDDEFVELTKDLTFKSPSSASSFCYGNSSNGWITWVNDKGETLDEVFRG